MTTENKTLQLNYRFLSANDFAELHQTLLEAYSDYIIPFQLSETQLKNHIAQNAVDLNFSVGVFADNKMIAFTLNGFGVWDDKKTAYDAGTGVIQSHRNQGIGTRLFEFMLPELKKTGIEQILLEVITHNEKAVGLYRKLGFEETRTLICYDRKTTDRFPDFTKTNINIREIERLDWDLCKTFWDRDNCWQNSAEAIDRSSIKKIILGAYSDEKCVGYGIVTPVKGFITQLAIDQKYRRQGIASKILSEMQKKIGSEKQFCVTNLDFRLSNAIIFFQKMGFEETVRQMEMIKSL